MIYEWRIYKVTPGKMNILKNRFANYLVEGFEKHGIKVIGFWETVIGRSNLLYYMLAYDSLGHREEAWKSFFSDSELLEIHKAEEEKNGLVTQHVTNIILKPTEFSPLK